MTPPPTWPPPWATAYGDDPFGLWAEFTVAAECQRMRWLPPGEFWMGSPDDEPKRKNNEGPRHRVRLSRGLWLADTACTQALWLAVMGPPNPSRFAVDPQAPVEQVSCEEVEGFLRRLQVQLGPHSQPALPTEAEWEFACRAGSDGPFAFGDGIGTDQANYDGNYPYAGGAKGEYRSRTVAVKALPANRWGLYQMHGNVWEWCADRPRPYPGGNEVAVDPSGPQEPGPEAHRAVRGGSWFYYAGDARSACRGASRRGNRYHDLGFRLALRS